jgi:hypothetical protein
MGSGDGRPKIQGTTAGPAAITARRCVVDNYIIEKSQEISNVAVDIPSAMTGSTDFVTFRNTKITQYTTGASSPNVHRGIGAAQDLITLSNTEGDVLFDHVEVICKCDSSNSCDLNETSACCDTDSACIHINANPGDLSEHRMIFQQSRFSMPSAPSVAGAALFKLTQSPAVTLISNFIYCEQTSGAGTNCFEVDHDDVARLSILDSTVVDERTATVTSQGRFIEVIGTTTSGSDIVVGHVDGSQAFVTPSIWGDNAPSYAMGCSQAFGAYIHEDDVGNAIATDFNHFTFGHTITQVTPPDTTANHDVTTIANVQQFRAPTSMALFNLYWETGTANVAGGFSGWLGKVYINGTAASGGCLDVAGVASCSSGNLGAQAGGAVVQQGDLVTLSFQPIDPIPPTTTNPTDTDVWISICAAETPP